MHCLNCGADFKPRCRTQKFCRDKCRSEFYGQKYYHEHKAQGREKSKRYYQRHKAEIAQKRMSEKLARLKELTCPICGKVFKQRHGLQRHCSAKCRELAHLQRRKAKRKAALRVVTCQFCGKLFSKANAQKYCSDACRYQAKLRQNREATAARKTATSKPTKPEAKIITPICPICGKSFETKRHSRKYCSATCRRKAEFEQRRIKRKAISSSRPKRKLITAAMRKAYKPAENAQPTTITNAAECLAILDEIFGGQNETDKEIVGNGGRAEIHSETNRGGLCAVDDTLSIILPGHAGTECAQRHSEYVSDSACVYGG